MKKIIYTSNAPEPIGPYSQAVIAGNMLYASGQVALTPSGELVDGSVQDEAHQVMKNIGAVLSEAGLDYSHIVKTSIFLKSMDDFAAVNEIYGSYFTGDEPARETVEVSRLPKDVRVEISITAIIG